MTAERLEEAALATVRKALAYDPVAESAFEALLVVVRERAERLEQEKAHLNELYSAQTERRADAEARLGRAAEALNLALMHLEDERAIASVRAVLAEQEKEQR